MHAFKKSKGLLLLIPFLMLMSCKPIVSSEQITTSDEIIDPTPKDYEIDETINNVNGGVYYEIFVRSFADSNGDGHGDLAGIKEKIPYLEDLGVKGLWLTPIHPSPSYHGYDVTDYYGIHSDFGTMRDFEELISVAQDHHIDIIIDLVINHSSSAHPWFLEGRKNFKNNNFDPEDHTNKANWYDFYWDNGEVKTRGFFGDAMPEFMLDNISVRTEIQNMVEFWLEKGVKGFRLDATSHFYNNTTDNVNFLKWFSNEVKSIREDAYIVAEAWINSFDLQKSYYGGVESLFNFSAANVNGYIIDRITSRIGTTIAHYMEKNYNDMYAINEDGLMAMFLTNHDMDRSSQMYLFDFAERQKLAASIYLLTPGVPFMYYGEEIGLKGSRMNNQTDANRRLPMIWQKTNDTMRPALPPHTDYPMSLQVKDGVQELKEAPFSLLNHYKKVISVRNSYPWIKNARLSQVPLNNNALMSIKLTSKGGDEFIHVIHNVHNEAQSVDLSRFIKDYDVIIKHDIYSVEIRAELINGTLDIAPYSTVILERKI